MSDFVVTNTRAHRITIGFQDIEPGQVSKPIQVMGGKGFKPNEVNPEATAALVEKFKASPAFRSKWLVEGAVSLPPPPVMAKIANLDLVEDAKALILIKIEDDMATLANWAESENKGPRRKTILEAIGTRAAAIGNKG